MGRIKNEKSTQLNEYKQKDKRNARNEKFKSKFKLNNHNVNKGDTFNIELQNVDFDKADEALLKAKKKKLDDAFKKVDREDVLFAEVDFSDQEGEVKNVLPARSKGKKIIGTSQTKLNGHETLNKTVQNQSETKLGNKRENAKRPQKLALHENFDQEKKSKVKSNENHKINQSRMMVKDNKLKRKVSERNLEQIQSGNKIKENFQTKKQMLKKVPESDHQKKINKLIGNYYLPEDSKKLSISDLYSTSEEDISSSGDKQYIKNNIVHTSPYIMETNVNDKESNISNNSNTIEPSTSKCLSHTMSWHSKEKLEGLIKTKKARRRPLRVDGTELRQKMMERIKAAQFRLINETLYTSSGNEAKQLFQKKPEAFQTYHEGFRQQVKKWPINPIKEIISKIKKLPPSYVIADMGCGDATLSKSVPHKVNSFDLVAAAPGVVECDISRTPLQSQSVDVVVFCLALMGKELQKYLAEANRILKMNGKLLIAEVESRFENVDSFITSLRKLGFKNNTVYEKHKVFLFMDFTKIADSPHKRPLVYLKPCLYKKR